MLIWSVCGWYGVGKGGRYVVGTGLAKVGGKPDQLVHYYLVSEYVSAYTSEVCD